MKQAAFKVQSSRPGQVVSWRGISWPAAQRGGFTLLELLVVIAIIGILVSILLPSVAGMKKRAKIRQAETEVNSLAMAVRAYHTEYDVWPVPNPAAGGTWSNENKEVFRRLMAGQPENSRNINFIELSSATNSLCDPLGSNTYYVVTISVTNNSVTVTSPSTGFTATY